MHRQPIGLAGQVVALVGAADPGIADGQVASGGLVRLSRVSPLAAQGASGRLQPAAPLLPT
jgi:hypothetical protein